MCRGARSNQQGFEPRDSPRLLSRPAAPTPEQTNHWLRGMDVHEAETAGLCDEAQQSLLDALAPPTSTSRASSPSPSPTAERTRDLLRPRSPTPTKMLVWEEEGAHNAGAPGVCSPDSDHEGRGDHTDGVIARLIHACQQNDVQKAFAYYEKLRQMRVPLYEGVYKLIIECCMRTQQLGHAMQFYEMLKTSVQRVSPRLVMMLMDACAREQHGDKVYAIWNDWCPPSEHVGKAHGEVLLAAVSALIRTMSPELAAELLRDAARRSGDNLSACLSSSEVEVEELLELNENVAEEAQSNGTLLEELASRFNDLHALLEGLSEQCTRNVPGQTGARHLGGDTLLMEDVDLDLELAAM